MTNEQFPYAFYLLGAAYFWQLSPDFFRAALRGKKCAASSGFSTLRELQKGKYKNPIVQKSKRCEIVKSNNRIIKKLKSSNLQNTWNSKMQ